MGIYMYIYVYTYIYILLYICYVHICMSFSRFVCAGLYEALEEEVREVLEREAQANAIYVHIYIYIYMCV